MKILSFQFRGQQYKVNEAGEIKANGLEYFSKNWIFRGGLHHHFCNHVTRPLKTVFNNPSLLEGCLGADIDHGTNRVWDGMYCGKLPRITNAHIIEE